MRICHISINHKPDDDRIYYKEVLSLAKKYNDIWVVTPEATPPANSPVQFRFFPPYTNDLNRIRSIRTLARLTRDLRPDLVHCHEPESLRAALLVKSALRCRVIYDSHELYPAAYAERFPVMLRPVVEWMIGTMERRAFSAIDGAIGAAWGITDYLSKHLKTARVTTLLNVPSPSIFEPGSLPRPDNRFLFCHEGHLSFDRGLREMLEALRIVARKYPVRLRIVGDVFGEEREWLDHFVRDHHLEDSVERTGWLPYEKVGAALSGCQAGLICFHQTKNNALASPNKLFNYLLYGIPVIAPAYIGSIKRLLQQEHCGIPIPQLTAEHLSSAMIQAIEDQAMMKILSANALMASRTSYTWEVMEGRLYDLYDAVCFDSMRKNS